jgi:hypothetical protein
VTKNPKRAPELHLKNTETRFDILKAELRQRSEEIWIVSIDIKKQQLTRLLIMLLATKQSALSSMFKVNKIITQEIYKGHNL